MLSVYLLNKQTKNHCLLFVLSQDKVTLKHIVYLILKQFYFHVQAFLHNRTYYKN